MKTRKELIKEIQEIIDNEVYELRRRLEWHGYQSKRTRGLNNKGWKVRIDGEVAINKMKRILDLVKEEV